MLPLPAKTGLRPQPRIGAVIHNQFCDDVVERVHDGCSALIRSKSFAQNCRYSSFLDPAATPAVDARTDFCQSLGRATTLNSGAGTEPPILTTSSSTPKK